MKKNKIAQYCCIALVAVGFGLNIQNAIENYGLGEDSHSLVADGDSSTGSDSSSGPDGSNGDSNQDTSNNGSGPLVRNFKLADVWYRTTASGGVVLSYVKPDIALQLIYTWTSLRCCITGPDASGCDFYLEDDKCKNTVDRPAH